MSSKVSLKFIVRSFFVFVVVCLFGLSAHAAFTPTDWQYMRQIDTYGASGMVKALLPEDISWTARGFSDLRIIDGQGTEVPYLLSRNISSSGSVSGARLIDLVTLGDGTTSFVADFRQQGIVRTGLKITSTSANFRRQVKVYASDSLIPSNDSRWTLVTGQGYIFRFTDPYTGFVSGKDTIEFPANSSQYFKVVISAGQEGPVSVASVSAYRDVKISALTYSNQLNASIYNNPTKRTTEITIDLGISGKISDSVLLSASDTNYSRRVIIDASDSGTTTSAWKYVGQSSISSISTSLFRGSSNLVQYGEQRARYIRLSVVNDDSPVLNFSPRVTVSGPILAAIFEANPTKSYSLYYGNPTAKQPQYDITNISQYIEEGTLPTVTIGSESANSVYVAPAGPVIPFTEANKWLLNVLLVVVVLVILAAVGLYLHSYVKKNGVPPMSQE